MSLMVWLPLNGDLNNQGLGIITHSGNPIYKSNGKFYNKSLDLSQQITFNCTDIANKTKFTISFWAKVNSDSSLSNDWVDIIGFYDKKINESSNGFLRWETCYSSNLKNRGISGHDNATYYITGGPNGNATTKNEWHNIVCVVGDDVKEYRDGILTGTYTANGGCLTGYFWLGQTGLINGEINDVRIYDHTLSPLEVKHLAQGLVLHYPLDRQGFGQDNLYTGSKNFSGSWVNLSSWTTDSESYSGFTVKKKSSVWGGLAQNITCTNGDIFTISFYAKVDSGGNILSIHRSSLGNVTTGLTILDGNFKSGTDWVTINDDGTKWKYYWATVKITSSDITYLQWRIENSVTNKYLYICGMKLERGSIATLWTPAPSDDLYSQIGLNSNIEEDVSGYGNDGTRIGTFSWSGDTPRYVVSTEFNGSQYIQLPFPCGMISEAVTVTCWGYESNWNTTYAERLIGAATSSSGWCIGDYGSENTLFAFYANGSYNTASGFKQLSDGWHHFAITFDGINLKYYVDGALFSSKTFSAKQSVTGVYNIQIGQHYGGTCNFRGNMSDVRIYATALSEEDVLELYHTPISLTSDGTLMTQGEYVEV